MSSPRNKRSGGGNPTYKLTQGVHSSNPGSRDVSPSQGVQGYATQAPHYPTQSTPSQLPPPGPPLASQRVGLLPHPVGFPPPPGLIMPGGLAPPSQFPSGPPPPLPQPGELGGMTSLTDITTTVSSLGFPGSCNFVLGLLHSYFTTSLASTDTKSKPPSQLTRDNLQTLVDLFIVCQPPAFTQGVVVPPSLPPLNEVQLLLSIHRILDGQQKVELHYCIFDAIFGGVKNGKESPGDNRFELLKKLVSFAISTECSNILDCASLWMRSHPLESADLVKALYYDFCVLVPNAHGPLMQIPASSPHFAQQLALNFTILHPFHSVSRKGGVAPTELHLPMKMLQIVSHWLSAYPNFLSAPPLLDKETSNLPLVHSNSIELDSNIPDPLSPALQSLLPGLMQWCVLAPLCPDNELIEQQSTKPTCRKSPTDRPMDTMDVDLKISDSEKNDDTDIQTMITSLHADLLSGILSLSKPLPCQLSRDKVAVLIANLLGYRSQIKHTGGQELNRKMEECVERLAQLLQISLSSGLLNLRPDDISSLASTLPKNRLLQLIIAHAQQKAN